MTTPEDSRIHAFSHHGRRAMRCVGVSALAAVFSVCVPGMYGQVYRSESQPSAVVKRDAKKAEDAYLNGARALDRRDLVQAQKEFAQAVELNPSRVEYAQALERVRNGRVAELLQQAAKARLMNQPAQADALLAEARRTDPKNESLAEQPAGDQHIRIEPHGPVDGLSFAPPLELVPAAGDHAFHAHGDVQQVIRDVATAYGVNAAFDESVGHADIRFALEEAPYDQAMQILLHMTHTFAVPLNARSILVLKDTQENRTKYERLLEETIYVPGSTNEEMTELVNIVKNVFDVKQVSPLVSNGTLLIRAPESTLKVVNYTLADIIDGGAEVMMDMKLYEVDTTLGRNTGATLPGQFGAFSVAAEAQSIVSANQSIINQAIAAGAITLTGNSTQNLILEAIFLVATGVATNSQVSGLLGIVGGGLSTLGVYQVGGATYNLSMNSSDTRAIDNVQVRVDDRQTNTLKLGSKYPITTASYSVSGAASSLTANLSASEAALLAKYLGTTGSAATTATTPQVQYEDLGLTLKTTPTVQKSGFVALHLDLKIEALTGSSLDGNPVLSSRVFTSDVTVEDGTSAVVASTINKNESGAVDGIPGLSELPGFRDVTSNITEKDTTELVIVVTPHIVRHRRSEIASPRIAFHTSAPVDY